MMSETRYKLHWVTSIIEVLKVLKSLVLPIIFIFFTTNRGESTGLWYLDYFSFILFGLLFVFSAITGFINWKRFEYWFEDDELRIESGLFVKKKRYIPFDRIQSLDYTEGILHRPFKLVKVKVETAGGTASLDSEAELTAITKEAANVIEVEIDKSKKRKLANSVMGDEDEEVFENSVVPEAKPIFTMSGKDLLILATTSGGIGLILSGVMIFFAQFGDLLPLDRIYEGVSGFIRFGVFIVAIAVFLGFLVVWGISVVMTLLAYYGFSVSLEKEDIVITRGLIEKKRATIPLNRVQSVRIVENPFRQLFGYANVVIDNAGGGLGDGAKINLFPLVKKADINGPLKEIFPELIVEEPTGKLPARGKRYYYRIDILWMLPIIGALTYFFFPYGLLSLLLIPIVVLWGLYQHRSAAYEIFGNQLTLRFRGFSLQTAYMMKKRIQSMEMKQNYFHRRKKVATISSRIKSGVGVFNAQVSHMEEEEAERILCWYEPLREQKSDINEWVENRD